MERWISADYPLSLIGKGAYMNTSPLVSIIIRTCGKPSVLNNALQSVKKQTYTNIEVILVEDGENISEHFIQEQYPDLRIRYHATKVNQGRSAAGNIGLSMAEGKYCNFLDEDDILLSTHVETLVNILETAEFKAAYTVAEENQIVIKSSSPYRFAVKRKLIRYRFPFNRLLLCYMNLFPIQSVMFERTLYEEYGGFDEGLDVLEDWDLWLRFALNYSFQFVDKVTSVYYTPYKNKKKLCRDLALREAEHMVMEKHRNYQYAANALQINRDMDYILNQFNQKKAVFIMKKIRNFLLYRDR